MHPDGKFYPYRDESKDFPIYGQAPTVRFDSMNKTYHHGAERFIESRKEWELADKETGCISFGSVEDAKPKVDEANERKKRKEEKRNASYQALQEWKQNPKDMHDRVEKQSIEKIETLKKLGIEI